MNNVLRFKQGVIAVSSKNLFKFSDKTMNRIIICEDCDMLLSFAYSTKNYMVSINSESELSWEIRPGRNWLYVELDVATGVISTGVTDKRYNYGIEFPITPETDDYFFHTKNSIGYFWSGSKWIACNRVFVGSSVNGTINQMFVGSQVNLRGSLWEHIMLTDNLGLSFDDIDTPAIQSPINKSGTIIEKNVDFSPTVNTSAQMYTVQDIEAYTCVTVTPLGVDICDPSIHDCIGITTRDVPFGEHVDITTIGHVYTPGVSWAHGTNTALYVGNNGNITTEVPPKHVQQVGRVVSNHMIYINTKSPITIL